MTLLKNLSNYQIVTILGIIILVTTTLYLWERYEHDIENTEQTQRYNKLYEENKLLHNEINNLIEQNQLLYKVLGLKQDLQ